MRGKFVILLVGVLLGFLFLIFPETTLAATYTVNKTADTNDGTCDADCSLREAVTAANGNAGNDTVEFNIPTSDSGYIAASGGTQAYWSLTFSSSSISLSDSAGVYINGYSQSGSSRNTASFGETINTILTIEIIGSGVRIVFNSGANSNHVTGISYRTTSSTNSFDITTSSNNWIEGNFFGSNITGTTSANCGSLSFKTSSDSNTVGTNGDGVGDVGERNLFLGCGSTSDTRGMIQMAGNNNTVAGNYIGVDKTGRSCGTASMNRSQVFFGSGSSNGRIGTNYDGVSDTEEANIIACVNTDVRGLIRIGGVTNSNIQGNYIGTNPQGDNLQTGTSGLIGITVRDLASTNVVIKGNTIAYSTSYGIQLASFIPSTESSGVNITRNKIFSNTDLPIDLGLPAGINTNDAGDSDTGPNQLMNYPIITSVSYEGGSRYKVKGTMDYSPSEAPINIEIFKSDDNSFGHGGSIQYLGAVNPDSGGVGSWEILVDVPGEENTRRVAFTTTATNANGSTSEFSKNVAIGGSVPQPQYSTCQEKSPSYPPLVKVISTTSNSIKFSLTPFPLSFTDFTHYFLEYGEKPDTYYYGNSYITSKQNTSYTVTKLKPATTYFLRFGAANGCAKGSWTNEIKARTSGGEEEQTSEPEPTSTPTDSPDEFDLEQLPSEIKDVTDAKVRSYKFGFLILIFLILFILFFIIFKRKKKKKETSENS